MSLLFRRNCMILASIVLLQYKIQTTERQHIRNSVWVLDFTKATLYWWSIRQNVVPSCQQMSPTLYQLHASTQSFFNKDCKFSCRTRRHVMLCFTTKYTVLIFAVFDLFYLYISILVCCHHIQTTYFLISQNYKPFFSTCSNPPLE